MCGIAGIVNGGNAHLLEQMNNVIAHRGPDDQGLRWFADSNTGLAHRRLSIIDLSPAGHQPMSNERGDLWIVFNGEIYNYGELREELAGLGVRFRSHSDTETLLYAYQCWGEDCLSRLNGMFAFAIYDARQRRLFAARDRLGIKPFYYSFQNGTLVFASEIKAILASKLVPAEPDYDALHNPARFQIAPYTGFKNILKLHAGSCLTVSDGDLNIRPYWRIEPDESFTGSDEAAIEELDALLRDSVRLQMIADVPVGVFLSGGVDSSLVSALARKNTAQDIHSFTIRYADEDQKLERATPDEVYARQVARDFGFKYHEFEIKPDIEEMLPRMVWHLDEPVAEPAAINTYLISQAARDLGIIVLLNGMGGDEVFAGYRKHLACLKADTYQALVPMAVQNGLSRMANMIPVASAKHGFKLARWGKRFLSFASLPPAERYLMADLSLSSEQYQGLFNNGIGYRDTHFVRSQIPVLETSGISYLTRMCLNDTYVFLPEHNLTFSDKGSMAAGIESRPPLIDHRVVEFMFRMPPRFRIRGNTQKYLLKKVSEKYLPDSVIYRPKAPFASPLRSWIRGPLAPMIGDLLSPDAVRRRGLYDPQYVENLIQRNDSGLEDNAYILWTLLTNEIWFRTFFAN